LNLYLDTSALIKRYIRERGSQEVASLWGQGNVFLTSLITRAEIMATFAKAVRMNVIDRLAAEAQIEAFQIFLHF